MSCESCKAAQFADRSTFIRWKNANVALCGCEKHIAEILAVLRRAQAEPVVSLDDIEKAYNEALEEEEP